MGLSVVKDDNADEPWDYPAPEGGDVAGKSNNLADAATAALSEDDSTGAELKLVQDQTALIPACKVKFVGMSFDDLEDTPGLREDVAYLVIGRVVGHEQIISAQGDLREQAKVKVGKVRKVSAAQLEKIQEILGEEDAES